MRTTLYARVLVGLYCPAPHSLASDMAPHICHMHHIPHIFLFVRLSLRLQDHNLLNPLPPSQLPISVYKMMLSLGGAGGGDNGRDREDDDLPRAGGVGPGRCRTSTTVVSHDTDSNEDDAHERLGGEEVELERKVKTTVTTTTTEVTTTVRAPNK